MDSLEKLLITFEGRGMNIDAEKSVAMSNIKNIGYYKLKEYADPFMTDGDYNQLNFSAVVKRYYQDKNLRMHVLHVTEIIELAFKNRMSEVLGEHSKEFGYLDFTEWADKKKYTVEHIISTQRYCKKEIQKNVKKSKNKELTDDHNMKLLGSKYTKPTPQDEKNENKFPTVWLAFDLLSFGQAHNMYQIMQPELKDDVAQIFNCGHEQLNSWLGMIVLVRNTCAHNDNLVDIQLKTSPKIIEPWKEMLFSTTNDAGKLIYSNRLSSVLGPIIHLTRELDSEYGFGDLYVDCKNLVRPVRMDGPGQSQSLGFKDKKNIRQFFEMYRNV